MGLEEADRSMAKYIMYVNELYFESPFKIGYHWYYLRGRSTCEPLRWIFRLER